MKNWFVKKHEEVKEINANEAKAITEEAEAAQIKAEATQIKAGIERINRAIVEHAKEGRYSFYSSVFNDAKTENIYSAIVKNLTDRGFEVDIFSGRISWKSGVVFAKETFDKEI
jgi:ribosomal protein L9